MRNKSLIASVVVLQMILVLIMPVFANAKISDVTSDDATTYTLEEQEVNQEKRIIVKFKDKDKKEKFLKKKKRKLQKNIKKDTNIPMMNEEYSTILLDNNASTNNVISDIMKEYHDDIEFIQPDYEISVFSNEDNIEENLSVESHKQEFNSNLLDNTKENGDIIVAVIDTAVDINHQSYTDKIYKNTDEQKNDNDTDSNGYIDDIYGWDFVNNTDQSETLLDSNHGTHVTGLIAAKDIGVGENVKILPLKVFENGTAYTSDILNAIEYAENMGAKIVNCSWGTTSENPLLENAIKNSDMLFICAAGNSAKDIAETPVYPASYGFDNVISVGASNDRDYLTYFSNYGDKVDVVANGYNVNSTFVNNKFGKMNGTSMSAGYVTGVAAAVYTESASDTKEKLLNSCDKISTLIDKVNQGRRINYNNAIAGAVINDIKENMKMDYQEEHINKIINSSEDFELYDLDPEPIAIFAGDKHSLVLNSFGDVISDGDNTYKQLGKKYSGSINFMYGTIDGLWSIEEISTFANHSLALDYKGDVYAWGQNNRFQLGSTEDYEFIEVPTKVNFYKEDGSSPHIVDIEAGGWFSLALDSDGNVWAWGDNTYGQIATGYTGYRLDKPRIIMSGVSQISAGKYHALAIKDNIVYGWGRNAEDYPLGENANWSQTTPIEITGLTGDILNIEAGDRCSFFITTDGVYAMGLNNCGQLGDGTTETKNIPTLLDISATSIQSNGSTLFYQNGDVYACGANTHGQLGQGYKNTRIETPVKIRGCDYKQMAAGGSHNLLFKCNEQYPYDQYYFRNATIYAMGCNEYGQCMGYIKEDFLKPDVVCEIENTEDVGKFSWNYKDEYIRPIDSTTVSQIDSSMNFYGQPLQVNYTNNERSGDGYGKYSYLKFDISNVPKERISSAKLHLHLYGGDTRASTREIGIYDTYSNEWDGKTMTWESGRVGLKSLLNSFKVTANGYFFNEADEGWHEIDITDYLKYNCIDNELSLALKMISAQAHEVSFVSGIYNDNFTFQDMHINKDMPVLEIKYEQEDAISIQRKSYATSGDTYIYQQKPFNNFSEEQYISINYTPDESRNDYWGQDAYLSFNIDDITVDKRNNIGRAVLWLYVDDTSDTRNSERTINISANDGLKYNASTLVWKAGRISGDSNIGDFTVKGDGYKIKNPGWRQIDVTEFIKSARNSDIEFILKMTSVQAHPTNIRSSEHTQINTRPKLVIDNNLSMEAIDISNNHSTETSSEGTKLYKYVPKETNKYTFSSVGGTELSAILLDENMNQLTVSDNIDGEFKMTYNLEQDKIYYIRVSSGLAANTKYKLYVELPLIITIQ